MPPKIHAMFLHVGTSFFGRLGRFVVAMVGGSPCGLTKTDMNDCVCVRRGGRSTKECYCIINSDERDDDTPEFSHHIIDACFFFWEILRAQKPSF